MTLLTALLGCATATPPSTKGPPPPREPPKASLAKHQEPEVVTFEGAPGHRWLRAGVAGEVVARLRVGTRAMKSAPRPAVNLALVIDTSGSMEGDAIRDARVASVALVDALATGDRLAVVTFDTRATVLVPSTVLDATSRAAIRERLSAIQARGTTDLAGGLRAGFAEVTRQMVVDGVNRIVLMSDGVPNDAAPILPLADAARARGVTVTSLGLGVDYDETVMAAIAQRSGGRFHYIKDSSQVASVFTDEVLRLQRVVARHLTVQLSAGPGVTVEAVVGATPPVTGAGIASFSLGDLSEGEVRDVVVRLRTPARREGAVIELVDATLTFDDAVNRAGTCERRAFLSVRASGDQAVLDGGRDLDVLRAAARMQAASRVLQVLALARSARLGEAVALLDLTEREARVAAKELDDASLVEQVRELAAVRTALPSLVPKQPAIVIHHDSVRPHAPPTPPPVPMTPPTANAMHQAHDNAMHQLQPHPRH